mgnify:CR=1 FL=1
MIGPRIGQIQEPVFSRQALTATQTPSRSTRNWGVAHMTGLKLRHIKVHTTSIFAEDSRGLSKNNGDAASRRRLISARRGTRVASRSAAFA